jgi:hypothetical protein
LAEEVDGRIVRREHADQILGLAVDESVAFDLEQADRAERRQRAEGILRAFWILSVEQRRKAAGFGFRNGDAHTIQSIHQSNRPGTHKLLRHFSDLSRHSIEVDGPLIDLPHKGSSRVLNLPLERVGELLEQRLPEGEFKMRILL